MQLIDWMHSPSSPFWTFMTFREYNRRLCKAAKAKKTRLSRFTYFAWVSFAKLIYDQQTGKIHSKYVYSILVIMSLTNNECALTNLAFRIWYQLFQTGVTESYQSLFIFLIPSFSVLTLVRCRKRCFSTPTTGRWSVTPTTTSSMNRRSSLHISCHLLSWSTSMATRIRHGFRDWFQAERHVMRTSSCPWWSSRRMVGFFFGSFDLCYKLAMQR